MFKNLKPFFSFLLFLLFFFPSFFFFPSSSQTVFVLFDSSKEDQSYSPDTWTTEEKNSTLTGIKNKRSQWLSAIAFGLKKLEFKIGVKNIIYHFDKLAAAFQEQILKQKKLPSSSFFDFTQIKGKAQKQLLQVYEKGTTNYVNNFDSIISLKKYGNIFLDSIKPSLKKMQTLDLSQVTISYKIDFSLNSILENINKTYENLDLTSQKDVENFAFLTLSPVPNYAKIILDETINVFASSWLHSLQKLKGLGLTHLTFEKEKVDVSSLVVSKVQEASNLSLSDLTIIKKLWIISLSQSQKYQKNFVNLLTFGFSFGVFDTQIQTWIDVKLDSYKLEIQNVLVDLASAKMKKIKINEITYQVYFLLKNSNLQLIGSKLPQNAKDQLLALVQDGITITQLETALLEKQNQKKLIIGLSVGGGILFLSVLGGFLYWFFKIKK